VVIKKTKVAKPAGAPSSADGQRNYELMLVINPEWTEEKLSSTTSNISQFIVGLGGNVAEVKPLGKRRLAYPIKHFNEGYYLLLQFKLKSESGPELENRLNISEEIIRYLLKNME
jgi:small subunit ribosomal protein S6